MVLRNTLTGTAIYRCCLREEVSAIVNLKECTPIRIIYQSSEGGELYLYLLSC